MFRQRDKCRRKGFLAGIDRLYSRFGGQAGVIRSRDSCSSTFECSLPCVQPEGRVKFFTHSRWAKNYAHDARMDIGYTRSSIQRSDSSSQKESQLAFTLYLHGGGGVHAWGTQGAGAG